MSGNVFKKIKVELFGIIEKNDNRYWPSPLGSLKLIMIRKNIHYAT